MPKSVTGKPPGKPRGRPFPKGVPGPGRPKGDHRRQIEKDARLLARDHSVEAVRKMISIMRNRKATHTAQLIAANHILDRGYGRPPQAVEVFGGDVRPEEREGSALAILESRLAQLGQRIREEGGPQRLN